MPMNQVTNMYAVVTLTELIPLYDTNVLDTELTFHDVASPNIFSMPRDSTLKDALRELINRRIRRVFISGTNSFVSDREILRYIFGIERLALTKKSPSTMLDVTLQEVGPAEAVEIGDGETTLSEMTMYFVHNTGEPCVTCRGELVTPWDLVVKPWKVGRLGLPETAHLRQGIAKRKEHL